MCSEADGPAGKKPSSTGTMNLRVLKSFIYIQFECYNVFLFVCLFLVLSFVRGTTGKNSRENILVHSLEAAAHLVSKNLYVYFVYLGVHALHLYNLELHIIVT